MLRDNGSSRQPRSIAFDKDKAYVCSFDGTVARIDTTSLEIEAIITAGRNPDDICVQNNKLYVSNSGSLDYSGPGVDNTVSVIDITTFKETKKIEVGPNPGKILPGLEDAVYVVTQGADIEAGDYHLVRIDSRTDVVTNTYDEKALSFTIDGPIAYLYTYDYQTKASAIKVFDLTTGTVIRDNFITDGTIIQTPFSIQTNPFSGNIYITEAYNYTIKGDVLCFNQQGQLQYRLNEIGLNPNTIVFSDNGLPDDEWYELAGSEYGKDTETRGYEITYHRPQPANGDVRWTDNQGGEGYIYRNTYHQQDSYYPNWIEEDEITFRGTRLKDNAVNEGGTWVGYCYPWGYADNHPYNTEHCQFKIDWAVTQNGRPVALDEIDFIRIYTAVNQNVGWTGEISTEIMTIEDLHFEK